MTKQELIENITESHRQFCKSKDAYCTNCPYIDYYNCDLAFGISYLNKRHLIKGIEKESEV